MHKIRGALVVLLFVVAGTVRAADFPERPVLIVTPYAAGGGLDTITRTLAQRLTALWGHQVNVENRPGAGSTVGTVAAYNAKPDGYTLLVGSTPVGINPVVYTSLPYEIRRDFVPISLIATAPEVLVVNPALPAINVAELVALAKGGRKLNLGSAGTGTLAHLAADAFNRRAGLGGTHVPYKGSTPALTDAIGGQIEGVFDTPSAVLPLVRSGKVRALAIAAPKRSPQLPDVPTLAELGYPDLDFRTWMALFTRTGTPEALVRRIESGIAEVMRDPAFRAALTAQGWDVVGSSSSEFAVFLDAEMPKLAGAARAAGIKPGD
jgi:tripartite-type tricarboxylate transporter receptor subunit TctC